MFNSIETINFQPKYKNTDVFPYLKPQGVKRETEKAVCFQFENGFLWFPKSILDVEKNSVTVPHWFQFDTNAAFNVFRKECRTFQLTHVN